MMMTGGGVTPIAISRTVGSQPQSGISDFCPSANIVTDAGFVVTLREMIRYIAICACEHPWFSPRDYVDFVRGAFTCAYQVGLAWHCNEIRAMAEDFWFSTEAALELGELGENIGKGLLRFSTGPFPHAAAFLVCIDDRYWYSYFFAKSEDPCVYDELPIYFSMGGILNDKG